MLPDPIRTDSILSIVMQVFSIESTEKWLISLNEWYYNEVSKLGNLSE
jgi:hypothetical protein